MDARTQRGERMINDFTNFELNVLKLLHCIATNKRGWADEQRIYINSSEQILFPEKEEDECNKITGRFLECDKPPQFRVYYKSPQRFTPIGVDGNCISFKDNKTNKEYSENYETIDLLNRLIKENEELKDEVYEEIDNALTVLRDLYEDTPLKSQKKMNNLYNRLESLRDELK